MKKLVVIAVFLLVSGAAFAQDAPPAGDDCAKLQGVWYGAFDDKKIIFIFIDDIFIMLNTTSGTNVLCQYSVKNNNLILSNPRASAFDGWEDNPGIDEAIAEVGEWAIPYQYLFSGYSELGYILILGPDDASIALSRNYTD
jgi:hypothetical protein